MQKIATIIVFALLLSGCATQPTQEQRTSLVRFASSTYMPVLEYQMKKYALTSGSKTVMVSVPDPKEPEEWHGVQVPPRSERILFALRRLYPRVQFTSAEPDCQDVTDLAILKVRTVRRGGIISEMRGTAIVGGHTYDAIYYLREDIVTKEEITGCPTR